MFQNKKREIGIPGGLALALCVSMVVTFLGIGVLAWLISGETVGEGSGMPGVYAIQVLSAAIGAWVAMLCIRKMRLQICLLSGLNYYLVLLGVNALFFDGMYAGLGLSGMMVLVGVAIIAFWPSKQRTAGKKRKKAYR